MGKIKCSELRTKKKEELTKQLDDLKMELASLRVAKVKIIIFHSRLKFGVGEGLTVFRENIPPSLLYFYCATK